MTEYVNPIAQDHDDCRTQLFMAIDLLEQSIKDAEAGYEKSAKELEDDIRIFIKQALLQIS